MKQLNLNGAILSPAVVVNEGVPANEIWFVSRGEVVGKIVNIGVTAPPEPPKT